MDLVFSGYYLIAIFILKFYFISASSENGIGDSVGSLSALSVVTSLKQLCNHPDIVMEKVLEGKDGFQCAVKHLPDDYVLKYKR